jgi:hypothetical protein
MSELGGKWRYKEVYSRGEASGELHLEQDGATLSGKIIFTDRVTDGSTFMLQESLTGSVEGRKVKLKAVGYDVIHTDSQMCYELDSWFGILVDDATIVGLSLDAQGEEGYFSFERE